MIIDTCRHSDPRKILETLVGSVTFFEPMDLSPAMDETLKPLAAASVAEPLPLAAASVVRAWVEVLRGWVLVGSATLGPLAEAA